MIPCARESEAEMRTDPDVYLWQSEDGSLTAFARDVCPTADDAIWAMADANGEMAFIGWYLSADSYATPVRLGWSIQDDGHPGTGWWVEVPQGTPGAVECWMVS